MASKSRLILDGINIEELKEVSRQSDKLSETLSALVKNIVAPATADLDEVMTTIHTRLLHKELGEISLPELEFFLAELSAVMYRTQMAIERIGILSDMSKNVYEDVYATAVRNSTGSAKDIREAEGLMKAQYEGICLDIRKRAYSIAKLKMEGAERMNNALRKIITSRITEYTHIGNDGTDN